MQEVYLPDRLAWRDGKLRCFGLSPKALRIARLPNNLSSAREPSKTTSQTYLAAWVCATARKQPSMLVKKAGYSKTIQSCPSHPLGTPLVGVVVGTGFKITVIRSARNGRIVRKPGDTWIAVLDTPCSPPNPFVMSLVA